MLLSVDEIIEKAKESIKTYSADEAVGFMKEQGKVLFIDVRESSEYIKKSIPGVINIPRGLLEFKVTAHTTDADHPIIIHCAAGGRAVLAAKALVDMGFTNVGAITDGCDAIADAMPEGLI